MKYRTVVTAMLLALPFAACSSGTRSGPIVPASGNVPQTTLLSTRSAATIAYAAPLVITAGGTYRGNWQGTSSTPAVYVNTSAPVTIEDCNLSGPGTLIQGAYHLPIALTVANCNAYGTNTGPAGTAPGHFLSASNVASVIVEHNALTNTGGIGIYGSAVATSGKVQVLYNLVDNIDGIPNGGGACTESGTQPYCHRNFIELRNVLDDPNIEIAWNQIVNVPGESAMEDVILIDYSSGLASGPIRIHDNYIGGAYDSQPENAAMDYTGSGINAADGGTVADAAHATAFVHAYDNQVIDFENYGIGINAGHDNQVYDNRIITSNLLPDGAQLGKIWTGLIVHNAFNQPPAIFYNNTATGNVVGDTYTSARYGLRRPDCDFMGSSPGLCSTLAPSNTDFAAGTAILPSDEAAEYQAWLLKLAGRGFRMGPAQ